MRSCRPTDRAGTLSTIHVVNGENRTIHNLIEWTKPAGPPCAGPDNELRVPTSK
jgi:hypothetical protein